MTSELANLLTVATADNITGPDRDAVQEAYITVTDAALAPTREHHWVAYRSCTRAAGGASLTSEQRTVINRFAKLHFAAYVANAPHLAAWPLAGLVRVPESERTTMVRGSGQ